MLRYFLVILFTGAATSSILAQEESSISAEPVKSFTLGLYLDLFYGYDFNKPMGPARLPYLYHHNRHNEVNLNHGKVSLGLKTSRYRFNLGWQAGTYVNDNYAAEQDIIKNIFDANIGFALGQKQKWWLDAGIFGNSWIGMEATESYANYNLGHNLISENVPYYFAGVKINYLPNELWSFNFILTNGWQRIQRVNGNSLPALGTQVVYSAANGNSYNWSTFFGTDDPDASRRLRIYNDLHTNIILTEKLSLGVAFDIGVQQVGKGSSDWDSWYGTAIILANRWSGNWSTALRYEYYHDPQQVIVSSPDNINGYKTSSLSGNIDRHLFALFLIRLEARWFTSPNQLYPGEDSSFVNNNFFILGSIAMDWRKSFN